MTKTRHDGNKLVTLQASNNYRHYSALCYKKLTYHLLVRASAKIFWVRSSAPTDLKDLIRHAGMGAVAISIFLLASHRN